MADVNICPKCGSISIERQYLKRTKVEFPIDEFECRDCGYLGYCPIIDSSKIGKFKQELKESNNKEN